MPFKSRHEGYKCVLITWRAVWRTLYGGVPRPGGGGAMGRGAPGRGHGARHYYPAGTLTRLSLMPLALLSNLTWCKSR